MKSPRSKLAPIAHQLVHGALLVACALTGGGGERWTDLAQYESGRDASALRAVDETLRVAIREPVRRAELERCLIEALGAASNADARVFLCDRLGVIGGTAAVSAVARWLRSDPGSASLALAHLPFDAAWEPVRAAWAEASAAEAAQWVGVLEHWRDASAIPMLVAAAAGPDETLAIRACAALASFHNASAGDALWACAHQGSPARRTSAAAAFLRWCQARPRSDTPPEVHRRLASLLEPTWPAFIRRGAWSTLASMDPDQGLARAMQVVREGQDPVVRAVALARWASLDRPDLGQLLCSHWAELTVPDRVSLIQCAAASGTVTPDLLRQGLRDEHAPVRRAALRVIALRSESALVPELLELRQRLEADEAAHIDATLLELWPDPRTDQALLDALDHAVGAWRAALIEIVSRRRIESAIPRVLRDVNAEDVQVAAAAWDGLARLVPGHLAREVLDRILDVKDPQVRARAERAAGLLLSRLPRDARAEWLRSAWARASDRQMQQILVRLASHAPTTDILRWMEELLRSGEPEVSEEAARTIARWPTADAWPVLWSMATSPNPRVPRGLVVQGLLHVARLEAGRTGAVERCRALASLCSAPEERKALLSLLAQCPSVETLQLALSWLDQPEIRAEVVVAVERIAGEVRSRHPAEAEAALEKLRTMSAP